MIYSHFTLLRTHVQCFMHSSQVYRFPGLQILFHIFDNKAKIFIQQLIFLKRPGGRPGVFPPSCWWHNQCVAQLVLSFFLWLTSCPGSAETRSPACSARPQPRPGAPACAPASGPGRWGCWRSGPPGTASGSAGCPQLWTPQRRHRERFRVLSSMKLGMGGGEERLFELRSRWGCQQDCCPWAPVRLSRQPKVSGKLSSLAWLICKLKMLTSNPPFSTLSCTPLPSSTSLCLWSLPAKATSANTDFLATIGSLLHKSEIFKM